MDLRQTLRKLYVSIHTLHPVNFTDTTDEYNEYNSLNFKVQFFE